VEHELARKLRAAGLPALATHVVGEKIAIAYPHCFIVTRVTGLELEAQLTLNLTVMAEHAMNPSGGRKPILLLRYLINTWQLIFTDGSSVDVKIKLL
jgi:hypothetical protein